MRIAIACAALVGAATLARSQDLPPIMTVVPAGGGSPADSKVTFRVAAVDVDVKILGALADTRMTLTFGNPNPRPMAGDLYFPLPDGATLCGYALDVEGEMRDGVVVEKAKGRQVFESIVRQGLDPGLVQWTRGNHFQTRVFPIPARGSRRVMVRYVSDLVAAGGDALYLLPLNFRDAVPEFHIRMEVVKADAKPEIREGGLADFRFDTWRDSFLAETTVREKAHTNDLRVVIPRIDQTPVRVERNRDGNHYFLFADTPALESGGRASVPRRVGLIWDASGSRGGPARQREVEFLRRWLATLKGREVEVDLFLLRHDLEKAGTVTVRNGEASDLLGKISAIPYDGGTCAAALGGAAKSRPDLYLLFSDGLATFGADDPPAFDAPVYAITADSMLDAPYLRWIAARSGGAFLPLGRMTDEEAAARIGRPVLTLAGVEFDPAQIAAVHPSPGQPVQGRLLVAGRLLADHAELKLKFAAGGKTVATRRVEIRRESAGESDLIRPFWARLKIEELLARPRAHEPELTETGCRHGIVTPGTSLIVLETLDQYVEHGIEPPEAKPGWRSEYAARRAAKAKEKSRTREDKIDDVLRLWRGRVAWWEKDFEYPKNFKYREPKGRPGGGGVVAGEASADFAVTGMAAPASPAPAEGALPAPAADPAPAAGMPRLEAMRGYAAAARPASVGAPGDGGRAGGERAAVIAVKAWDPKTPYLAALKKASRGEELATYLKQRAEHADVAGFYLDCANFFADRDQPRVAVRILSNLAELRLEDAALLRVLAYRLLQLGEFDLAVLTFEEVRRQRPEEPQSHRDLALALARRAEAAAKGPNAHADFQRAVELLNHVVMNRWDRFEGIEVIALMELNRLLPRAKADGADISAVDARLVKLLDVEVRIVMTWDADLTDIDLWVTEPSGEKALYSHPDTTIGGHVSRDVTDGYGPEEYCLRRAMPGTYRIEANYYGQRAPTAQGPATVQVDLFSHYGRPDESRRSLTLRLEQTKEVFEIGSLEF